MGSEREGAPPTNEMERMRILELLEQGKITAAEAADLLSALDERRHEGGRRERGRWGDQLGNGRARAFRVRVTDATSGQVRANVSVPIGFLDAGLGFARRFTRGRSVGQLDDIAAAIRDGRRGTIFDVSGGDGERIEIIVE